MAQRLGVKPDVLAKVWVAERLYAIAPELEPPAEILPGNPLKPFISAWNARYEAKRGSRYLWRPKDRSVASALLKQLPLHKLEPAMDAYLSDDDPFLEKCGWSLGVFSYRAQTYLNAPQLDWGNDAQ